MYPRTVLLLALILLASDVYLTFAAVQTYITYISTSYPGTLHKHIGIRFHGNKGAVTFYAFSAGGFPVRSNRRFDFQGQDVGTVTAVDIKEMSGPSTPYQWKIRKIIVRVGRKVFQFPFNQQITTSDWVRIAMKCPSGFARNSATGSCEDINECARANSPCYGPHVTCRNTLGSFKCECPSGFYVKWSDRCQDINECLNGAGQLCTHNCINTPGSYRCECWSGGYKLVDGHRCEDINECVETKPCDAASTICVNYKASYACPCKPGYQYRRNDRHKCDVAYCYAPGPGSLASVSPAKCTQSNTLWYNDTCTKVCNHGYVPVFPNKMTMTCDRYGRWQGTWERCIGQPCPPLAAFPNGQYLYHDRCTKTGGRYGDIVINNCKIMCNRGYRVVGVAENRCQPDGTWSGKPTTPTTCEKIPPHPTIKCPDKLIVTLAKGQSTIALGDKWQNPSSNVQNVTVVKPVGANRFYRFPYGQTVVTWRAVNKDGRRVECRWRVVVQDAEPPTITYCPGPKIFYPTNETSGFVPYSKPTFTDNVRVVSVSPAYSGGYRFHRHVDGRIITYTARDVQGNAAWCEFEIVIGGTKCRALPDSSNLRGSWLKIHSHAYFRACTNGTLYSGAIAARYCRESDGKWGWPGAAVKFGEPIADCVPYIRVNGSATACPANYVKSSASRNFCLSCGRGTHYTKGKCTKCAAGTFQSKDAQDSCDKCPSGTSSLEGAFKCRQLCPAGTYSADGMRPFCKLCPSGQYQPAANSNACQPCAQKTNTKYGATACGGVTGPSGPSPVIQRVVSPGNVIPSKDVTLECYIRDIANVTVSSVTWKMEGIVPYEFLGVPKLTELTHKAGRVIGARLVITKATRHNADMTYVCEATNPHGVTRRSVVLKWQNRR